MVKIIASLRSLVGGKEVDLAGESWTNDRSTAFKDVPYTHLNNIYWNW